MFRCSKPTKSLRTTDKGSPDDGDLISELPDCLVTEILSRLPTKYAVRTSALSRNWKYKWTSIYDIVIHANMNKSFTGDDGFVNFANALTRLLLHTKNSRFRRFCLSFPYRHVEQGHFGQFQTCISDVLMRNVQYLELTVRDIKGLDSASCFSGWNLLTGLELEMRCTLKVPDTNCFPNLKWLWLAGDFVDGSHIRLITTKVLDTGRGDTVTLVFPVLEFLHLSRCHWLDVKYVEIQAPELISAEIGCSHEVRNPVFEIHGPKLAVFDLSYTPVDNIVLCAPAVTRMGVATHEVGGIGNLFKKCPNLKFLHVAGAFLRALQQMKLRLDFSTLDQLKELVLIDWFCSIEDVIESLQIFPHLESLTINMWVVKDSKFVEASTFTPKILSRLKKVKLLNYSERKAEDHFVKYLLQNAKNLEEITIGVRYPDTVKVVHQSLSKLKSKGSNCKLVVEQNHSMCGRRARVVYPRKY